MEFYNLLVGRHSDPKDCGLDIRYGPWIWIWRLESVPLSVRWIAGIVFQLLAPLHHDETPV